MSSKVSNEIKNYKKQHRESEKWYRILICLACIVVFVTTYVLILPAITMEGSTYCGYEEHIHSIEAGCYEDQLVCELEEDEEHTHTDACFEQVLICTKPEHVHEIMCYSNQEADMESAAYWEQTIPFGSFTEDSRNNLILTAQSQVGYWESNQNFIMNGEEKLGYNRYGAWAYDPYAKWNHLFVQFCLSYANVPNNLDYDAVSWIINLQNNGYWLGTEGTVPRPGNIIVFTDYRVGIIESFDAESQIIHTIEGDWNNQVARCEYNTWDSYIAGYINLIADPVETEVIPEETQTEEIEPEAEESITEEIKEEEGEEKEEIEEKEEEQEKEEQEEETAERTFPEILTYEGKDFLVTAQIPEEAQLPENTQLKVEELTGERYEQRYQEAMEATGFAELTFARFFDITFVVEEEEIEPLAPVQIEITYTDETQINPEENGKILHFKEEGIEIIEPEIRMEEEGTTFTFANDDFSEYGTVSGPMKAPPDNVNVVSTINNTDAGIKMNLFDYTLIDNDFSPHDETQFSSSYSNPVYKGINSGRSRDGDLLFFSYGGDNASGINHDTQDKADQGILNRRLTNGYPTIQNSGHSLDYLFDQSTSSAKRTYMGVNGLLQKDNEGYYFYDSESNYAYYDASTNWFEVYDTTYRYSCYEEHPTSQKIGFYPFNEYNSNQTCVKNFGHNHYRGQTNYGTTGDYYDHHFGMTMEGVFQIPLGSDEHYVFSYSGDDDMWVFIDDVLVLDVGGIHQKVAGSIDFSSEKVSVYGETDTTISQQFANAGKTWDKNAPHTIKMFYLERGGCYSNLSMRFKLPIVEPGSVEIEKKLAGNQDAIDTYKDKDYQFVLETYDTKNHNRYNGTATRVNADGTTEQITITNGSFTLKKDQKLRVQFSNEEIQYRVYETDIDGNIIYKVSESYTKQEQTMNKEQHQEFHLSSDIEYAKVKDRPLMQFVNTLEDLPIKVTVEKQWFDETNPPEEIELQLYRQVITGESNQPINPYEKLTLTKENNWKKVIDTLPRYDENRNRYQYYIREIPIKGYQAAYSPEQSATASDGNVVYTLNDKETLTITNTINLLPVKKRWVSVPYEEYANKDVYLALCDSNGNPLKDAQGNTKVIQLNESSHWEGTFIVELEKGKTVSDMHYTIQELNLVSDTNQEGFTKGIVENSNQIIYYKNLVPNGGFVTINQQNYTFRSSEEDGTFVATNFSSYKIPETGGSGSHSYIIFGILLMISSLYLGYALHQKEMR